MTAHPVLRALGPLDARSIWRDPLLRWFVLLPLALALLVRWIMPPAFVALAEWIGHDLAPYYDPLVGYALVILAPSIAGMVVGFMLLDQRDEGTLSALLVAPISPGAYLAYRLVTPMLAGFIGTLVMFPLGGLGHVPPGVVAGAALAAAPAAPIFALFLGAFARNKVEGFAIMKASGVVQWPPMIAFFVPMPWQVLIGVFPAYWPARVYWSGLEGDVTWPLWIVPGLAWQAFLVRLLLRRYRRVVRR